MKKRTFFMAGLALALGMAASANQSARAATITVGMASATCVSPQFATIQAAVNAAHSGDTIRVCPGTYAEQVSIPTGKNHLTLVSTIPFAATIQAPPAMTSPKAIVHVAGAKDATIQSFTISGPGDGACDSIEFGVLVNGGGSAAIRFNHITLIKDTGFSGCQNGIGVLVGGHASTDTGSATIAENFIDQYQKGGVVVSNAGSKAGISGNDVHGIGPTPSIAQNGIQVSNGAAGEIEGNDVADNVFSGRNFASAGVLLFAPGHVEVENNHVIRNDVNVWLFDTKGAEVSSNRVTDATFEGIFLQTDTTSATTGNKVFGNVALNNGDDGILVDIGSTGNSISHNRARNNVTFDVEDDSVGSGSCGTANTWTENNCKTDNQGGCLCDQDHHDDEEDQAASAPLSRAAAVQNSSIQSGANKSKAPSPFQ
jgi:parallel beta-helix repeat protein